MSYYNHAFVQNLNDNSIELLLQADPVSTTYVTDLPVAGQDRAHHPISIFSEGATKLVNDKAIETLLISCSLCHIQSIHRHVPLINLPSLPLDPSEDVPSSSPTL